MFISLYYADRLGLCTSRTYYMTNINYKEICIREISTIYL